MWIRTTIVCKMIGGMVQVTHFNYWMKYRQFKGLLLFRLSNYSKFSELFAFSLNQYNINCAWPNTANSIMKQLTQLFPHMFIHAYTDYLE